MIIMETYYGAWDESRSVVIKDNNYLEHHYERIDVRLVALKGEFKS